MRLFLKNLLFTVVVPGSVAGWLPWRLARGEGASSVPVPSAVLFALGLAVYAWCVWDFATFGRGTPAPIDAPRRLVVRGLYRWTRNPMYVGVLTVVVGWMALTPTRALALYGAIVACVFHAFVRLYEEPHLERVFGEEYRSYRRRVGRWLPRRSPR